MKNKIYYLDYFDTKNINRFTKYWLNVKIDRDIVFNYLLKVEKLDSNFKLYADISHQTPILK